MVDQHYSLWLLPEPSTQATLQWAVEELSKKLGGPLFTPHVTLLSQIAGSPNALAESAKRLACEISSFELTITGVALSEDFFRAIVLELADSPPFNDACARAGRTFTVHPHEPSAPHLSLAYGHIDESRARAALMEILPTIPAQFTAQAIELVSASSETPVEAWRSLCTAMLHAPRP